MLQTKQASISLHVSIYNYTENLTLIELSTCMYKVSIKQGWKKPRFLKKFF